MPRTGEQTSNGGASTHAPTGPRRREILTPVATGLRRERPAGRQAPRDPTSPGLRSDLWTLACRLSKVPRQFRGGRTVFSNKWLFLCKMKHSFDPHLTPQTKTDSTRISDLNVKPKRLKLSEENGGKTSS